MLIKIYETNKGWLGDCVGVIDEYNSLNFTKSFKGVGNFTIKGNYSKEMEELLKPDRIISITPKLCGVIHSFEVQCNQNGEETYTAYGMELKGILAWRIVWNTLSDDTTVVSYIEKIVMSNAMGNERRLINSAQLAEFETGKISKQVSYKNLQETIQEIVENNDSTKGLPIGYDIYINQEMNQTVFEVLEGEDRTASSDSPIIFSREFDNITDMTYTLSKKDSVNTILCAGEGEGDARTLVSIIPDDWGFTRKEAFVDARELRSTYKDAETDEEIVLTPEEYKAQLLNKAKESLVADVANVGASAVLLEDATKLLGSKITVLDKKLNIMADDYIAEINLIDEADGLQTTLSIGNDIQARRIL